MSDDRPVSTELLTADDLEEFFACDDRTTIDVFVPEWKRTFRIKQLSAAQLQEIKDIPKEDGMAVMVALSVVDSNGDRLFKDHKRLNGRSLAALNRIQDVALKLNGLTGAAAAAMAAAAKNG